MYRIFFLFKFVWHWITARHTRGYGVHSPRLFYYVRAVLRTNYPYYKFREIEALRLNLNTCKRKLDIVDYGTGRDRVETVKHVLNSASSSATKGQFLYRTVACFKPKTILELGTSLGLGTAYLASFDSSAQCATLEGCPDLVREAKANLHKLGIEHVQFYQGPIDNVLDDALSSLGTLDMVCFDANHRSGPTWTYFEKCLKYAHPQSVFVFDDIHWSADMEHLWKKIKAHPDVAATIDLFFVGVVFFGDDVYQKNFKIRYHSLM